MVLEVKTRLFPYRLVLNRKKPVELKIDLTNASDKKALASLELSLPRSLSLDKSGLKGSELLRLGELSPNESKTFYFEIYPKAIIEGKEHLIRLKATEHHLDYNYIAKEVERTLTLLVD